MDSMTRAALAVLNEAEATADEPHALVLARIALALERIAAALEHGRDLAAQDDEP